MVNPSCKILQLRSSFLINGKHLVDFLRNDMMSTILIFFCVKDSSEKPTAQRGLAANSLTATNRFDLSGLLIRRHALIIDNL